MMSSQRLHCCKKENSGVVKSRGKGVGQKGQISITTDMYRAGILDGHREIGKLEGYGFRGTVTAGNASNQKGGQW